MIWFPVYGFERTLEKTCYCINLTGQVQRTEHNMGKTNPSSTADNYYPQKAESADL